MSNVGEMAAGSDEDDEDEWRDFLFAGLRRRDLDEGEGFRLEWWLWCRSLLMRSGFGLVICEGELAEDVDVEERRRVGLKVGSWNKVCWVCCC